jgi:hypothetical protein|tara:strand:+ start:1032 stop:1403 length:372 start_codon:yes stop_codon:yes gene_type:complete
MSDTPQNKIEELEDMMWEIKARLDHVEAVLNIEPEEDYDPTLHPSMEDDHTGDDDYFEDDDPLKHTHADGTEHSHEGGDAEHHHHEDGTQHDHEGGAEPHTHDEPATNYDTLPSDVEPTPEGK